MRAVCTACNATIVGGLGSRDADLIVHDAPWIVVTVRDAGDVLRFDNMPTHEANSCQLFKGLTHDSFLGS
jgi:hypothetical protein